MQLDADEDGEPFFKPPAIAPAPLRQRNDHPQGEEQQQAQQQSSTDLGPEQVETQQAIAAAATAEQEE